MANRRAEFTQADVARTIRGAAQAGRPVTKLRLPCGIEVFFSDEAESELEMNEWDDVLNGQKNEKRSA